MAPQTVADASIQLLAEYGVDTVFGIPGVHTLDYYRALPSSGLQAIEARHEQGAAFMADGYARAAGRPAGVCAITGPGLANAATGIGQAWADSVPMVVLTAVNPASADGRGLGRLHELHDQGALAAGLTDHAFAAADPEALEAALAESFAASRAERPRPAIVAIPLDVLPRAVERPLAAVTPPPPPEPDPRAVDAVVRALAAAERPAVILGGGCADASTELRELLRRLGAPVITTVAGKGAFPSSSALSLGSCLPLAETHAWLAERDLLLAIGTELAPTDTEVDDPIFDGTLIRVDVDADRLDDRHRATVAVQADAARFAEALAAALPEGRSPTAATAADRPRPGRAPWVRESHLTALRSLRDHTDESTRFVSDMTQLAYAGNIHFPVEHPRLWLHPVGFGSLGYAVPAAIGAAVADPDRRVVALVGDSGLLYTGQELATAVDLGAAVTIVVWNNDALGQIRDDMRQSGIEPNSVHPHNGDVVALARAYGCAAERIGDPADLGDAVERARLTEGPAVVEVLVDDDGPGGARP